MIRYIPLLLGRPKPETGPNLPEHAPGDIYGRAEQARGAGEMLLLSIGTFLIQSALGEGATFEIKITQQEGSSGKDNFQIDLLEWPCEEYGQATLSSPR